MQRLFFKRLLVASCVVALLLSFFVVVSPPSVVHALVNGSPRLSVHGCAQDLVRAHVTGLNHNGDVANWDSSWAKEWDGRPDKGSFETWNWYWKPDSSIIVTTWYSNGSSYPKGVRIPLNNTQDPYPVNCYDGIEG